MARTPTKQEEEPHNGLLVLLDLLPHLCRCCRGRDNLAGREWNPGQDWAEW
jgi:hypothetical protein